MENMRIERKPGFTLLELIIVIIIIGILATVGIMQFGKMTEKARTSEARNILGQIRNMAAAYYLENNNSLTAGDPDFGNAYAGIGVATGDIPSACTGTHFFSYGVGGVGASTFTATATRCAAGGKAPQGTAATTVILTTNLATGADAWSGTGL